MTVTVGIRRTIVAAAAAATLTATIVAAPSATAAPSPTTGLYGAADPTYDGVFRQSLAIMGLAANQIAPPAAAISWLLGQQCADGSFQAYRGDLSQPCAKADPVNYTGPDTNSTAVALMALMALDNDRVRVPAATVTRIVDAADKAGTWLRTQQNPDGGWPYYSGATSDANSTGLSLAGILTQAPSYDIPAYRKAARFLGTVAASCADGGGLAYQAGSKVDGSATAQGLIGLVGPMPVSGPRSLAAGAPCTSTAKGKATSYLVRSLLPTGVLSSSTGGADYSSTATAVLGLVAAERGRTAVAKATRALKANAPAYVTADGTSPGAAGLLLMVAEATGSKATSFGGLDLVRTLNASIRK
jgi:hypothetical protein